MPILLVLLLLLAGRHDAQALNLNASNNKIGVIEIKGTLTSSQEILKALKDCRQDPKMKAVIVRLDSPGGSVGPAQEIYREIDRTRKVKPVVASMGSVAASAAYYIASACTRIVSNPGTITGSIGVISMFPNMKQLFDKIGYETVTIKSGKMKDVGNPGRAMTDEERAYMQGTMDEVHTQFIRDVAKGRNQTEEKIREIADGRIIIGETAQKLGLVDELGNYEDAVQAAVALGHIRGEADLVPMKKKSVSMMELFLGSEASEKIISLIDDFSADAGRQVPGFM